VSLAARVPLYVLGLDEKMDGGVPAGSVNLVSGAAGSLKTTLAYSVLVRNALEAGRKGLYLSMEQHKESLLANMEAFGLEPHPDVKVVDIATLRSDVSGGKKPDWVKGITQTLKRYRKESGCDLIALDSLDALYALADFTKPRNDIFQFIESVRALDCTSFLLVESPRDSDRFGQHGVEEFLADGIVHLRLRESEVGAATAVKRYLGVVKMRGVNHPMDYYPLVVKSPRFAIVTK
jgi:KaiC/GvpD/RAD55 family RecA-like ATPase